MWSLTESQDVSKHDTEIVTGLRDALAVRIGRARFNLWFSSVADISVIDDRLVVTARDDFTSGLLRQQFGEDLRVVAENVCNRTLQVNFIIEDKSSNAPPAQPKDSGPWGGRHPTGGGTGDRGQETGDRGQGTGDSRKGAGVKGQEAGDAGGNQRAALAPPRRRPADVTFDRFVKGPCNALAVESARHAVDRPGRYSPILLFGPTAVGKTHLLDAIRSEVRRRYPRAHALYLTAEQFTTLFVGALQNRQLPGFRNKFRGVDFLLLDDAHFFAGKNATLVELQHTLDTLIRSGKQVVLTTDGSPRDLGGLGEEIVSRLTGGLVCEIDPPEFQTRLGIVRRAAERLGLVLSEEVLRSVATHIATNAREITGALNRLHATSQAMDEPITVTFADRTLAQIAKQNAPSVGLADVERAVCEVFGVAPQALKSRRTAASIAAGRTLAMFLARRYTRAALTEIGHHFGRKSHSTVITAGKRVANWVSTQQDLQIADRTCNVEEAIRRVEDRLRRA